LTLVESGLETGESSIGRKAKDAIYPPFRPGGDALALDLRTALHALGLVTGAVTSEDVLSAVFSQFCIGK
jgi:tRNA U34 5-carboxymethylaminomethyl modifying GTPase MnmE/TrmE